MRTLDPHHVRCPRCGGRAVWEDAFEAVPTRNGRPVPDDDPRPIHRWSSWHLRERFPSIHPWRAPAGRGIAYVVQGEFGVVRCPECHHAAPHALAWPDDAYYRWEIRGALLWATDAAHARVLLEYLRGPLRDPSRHGAHARSLRRLPAAVIAARNRDLVVRRIEASLRA